MPEVQGVYIVGAVRTPIGKQGGALTRVHPVTLGELVVNEALKRAGIGAELLDEVSIGDATQAGPQGYNMANVIGERAWGPQVPAATVNMLCGSSMQSLRYLTGLVASGEADIVLAGGVENNLMVSQGADLAPVIPTLKTPLQNLKAVIRNAWLLLRYQKNVIRFTLPKGYLLHPMGVSGDAVAQERGYSRALLDKFGFESQMKAADAMQTGRFKDEMVAVPTPSGYLDFDEGIIPNTSLAIMARKLRPSFGKYGLHTSGTASQISGGGAAFVIASEKAVKKHDLKPIARVVASAVVKTDSQKPEKQLIGPISAIRKVLDRAGLKIDDIDLFEINEAFASVVLAAIDDLQLDPKKVNVNGGAIALGHPLGVSGVRLPVTLLYEMEKRNARYGLAALCIGGGQAIATIFERV